ncbi:MAG: hypothetical protein IJ362_06245 [Oscillospiraceae bacterium]|nr:hypothetical protein [Oscillospiraceae bacterium]
MIEKLYKLTDTHRRQPAAVQKITMGQEGSKFYIKAHFADRTAKTIGRYNSREEAHAAMEQLSVLTDSKIK